MRIPIHYMSHVMRKPFFAYAKTKTQISCAVTSQLISAFVFAIRLVQALFYLNPKFQASSYLLRLYSPVCVRSGRKPRRPVFSPQGSIWPENNRICATLCKSIENSYSLITLTKYYHFVLRSILYRQCNTGHIKGRNPHNLTD